MLFRGINHSGLIVFLNLLNDLMNTPLTETQKFLCMSLSGFNKQAQIVAGLV